MGLLDKLTTATKKVTQAVETYSNKAQEKISGPSSTTAPDGTPKATSYVPTFSPLAESIPSNASGEAAPQDVIPKVEGIERSFTLLDEVLTVPAPLDAFNTYRSLFQPLILQCIKKAEAEYHKRVHDYPTFVEEFPHIYDSNLYPLLQHALNVLISKNIWNITLESLTLFHKEHFHDAIDDYLAMEESTTLTIQNNQQLTAGVFSLATDIIGQETGSFGVSSLFGSLAEGGKESAISSTGISPEQQAELYGRINTEQLINDIHADYYAVLFSLVGILQVNEHDVWFLDSDYLEEAANIFKNISNPNFPQDKLVTVLFDILDTNPYNKDYYKFLVSRFGETEEVKAIQEYFGYTDLNDPRVI